MFGKKVGEQPEENKIKFENHDVLSWLAYVKTLMQKEVRFEMIKR